MRLSKRCARYQGGFTYLWMLLLVAMLSLLLALTFEVDSTASQRDREAQLIGIGKQFRAAIGSYYELEAGGKKEYPASLDDLLRDVRVPGVRRHLRQVFFDPNTGKAEWALVKVAGRVVGVHSLSERVPIKQDGFDAEEASFKGKQSYAEWVFAYPADLMALAEPAATSASDAQFGRDIASVPRPSR